MQKKKIIPLIDSYTRKQTYGTAGIEEMFISCVDPSSGLTYSFCYTNGSPTYNGDFIMMTAPDVITPLPYSGAIPAQDVAAAVVSSNRTLWFAGSTLSGTKLCSFYNGSVVSCISINSNTGYPSGK